MILVPICNGELVDKLTILKIKMEKMNNIKLENVTKEYNLLTICSKECQNNQGHTDKYHIYKRE